jgi:hypothetical protein
MINYCEIVDRAMGYEMYRHRTLRTCLDPGSSEWNDTTMKEKVEILKKVAAIRDLQSIFRLYKKEYIEIGKPHVAMGLEEGMAELLKYFLKD